MANIYLSIYYVWDTGLSVTNKKMSHHKWSYLLSFLDLEGEADTASVDIIWI